MATESVDEILDKLVDYVGAGVGDMTRKKAKQRLDAYYTRECARKVLEIIGEDETTFIPIDVDPKQTTDGASQYLYEVSRVGTKQRNQLRAELRAAIKEVGGGK